MAIYSPRFINDNITPLYDSLRVPQDDRVVVRFLTMLNAGFFPATVYGAADDIARKSKTKRWKDVLSNTGYMLSALETSYREGGRERLARLEAYFERLKHGDMEVYRFSSAEKGVMEKVQQETVSLVFSSPDALETGRHHFIPLKGEDPEGLEPSGYMQVAYGSINIRKHSMCIYPERKDPEGLAKEAGDILGLQAELFLVQRVKAQA